ncbi:MAG TPA: efflux RND transporter permease subunit [Rhizomicrobium sp.]|jgi:multidrug efflux pump|nr:efflux RND transporter permease subunit [Rhizomicrobium sp.]
MGLSQFFIERPVFAWVIAIVIALAGLLAVETLPITQYPTIAPPAVTITATYPGASAETVQNSVTQVIEQQLTGVDNLLYFSSSSSSSGQIAITVTFAPGTNPDIAQVQVQNKVQQALPTLPTEVQQQGVVVQKSQSSFLLIVALYDDTGRYTNNDISDFLASKLQDPLSRVSGVGQAQVFGAPYAMRIWLDPFKLNNFGLTPSDVQAAVLAQNTQVSAGELGAQPTIPGQQLDATVTAQSRLQTPAQFRAIVLKSSTAGGIVHLGDVARVELGAQSYAVVSRMNGKPAAGIAIQLAPGANALTTADAVKAKARDLSSTFPPGVKLAFPVDNTTFIRLSINDVIKTLVEATILVVVVMFVFLQHWRTTLIPAIAVPVVLLGTFAVLSAFGYSINTLTMFALVLAIGLLVDDAIVVVENVERLMREEGLSPKDATKRSMSEITGALIGIALVLSAVFLPMAFFGGSTGVIYRQFSVTIVSAMVLSVMVALILTPALCATLLRPIPKDVKERHGRFFTWFNTTFEHGMNRYRSGLTWFLGWIRPALLIYAAIVVVMVLLFLRLPTAFLPEEDQGSILTQITLPVGATQARTLDVARQVERHYMVDEKADVDVVFSVAGFSFAGAGQNSGLVFVHLKNWNDRSGAKNHAPAIVQRAMQAFSQYRDARVFALVPPAVQELGQASGFDVEMEDRGGIGHDGLMKARNQFLSLAAHDPVLAGVRPNGLDDTAQLHIDIDQEKAAALGLSIGDINATLNAAWGGLFINDFVDRDRVKQVYMQADAPYRMVPDDLYRWYVRSSSGEMAPFSSFATFRWTLGPAKLERFNGVGALEIQGAPAPGQSSGAALAEVQALFKKLPPGIGLEWTGLSYQETQAGAQSYALYGISILIVFLLLAALYESWSIPLSVMLVIPLGIVGAIVAATLRGLYNDIYFQVGLLTTMGLAAKNAILIVEFAVDAQKRGETIRDAAVEGARLRLRPILMTSLAFIAGVIPLAVSTGAGAASQNDIGTGVIGGMLSATILAIFFVPLFYEIVRGGFKGGARGTPAEQKRA